MNGTASGGGYELALACEHIMLVDDRSSAVSLPELPLLGVLPGTGGLTRVSDKRHVRRDLADYFSTKAGGHRRQEGRAVAPGRRGRPAARGGTRPSPSGPPSWPRAPAARRTRPASRCTPLGKTRADDAISYHHVTARLDRDAGSVDITVRGPQDDPPADIAEAAEQGAEFWTLAVTRELDDLILDLRTNETELGTWVFRTEGDPARVLAYDELLLDNADDWLANEILHYLKRTLKRLDVTSRSLIALIEPGSCFAGSLLELALAADRSYQLAGVFEDSDPDAEPAAVTLGDINLGPLTMGNGLTRLQTRFWGDDAGLRRGRQAPGEAAGGRGRGRPRPGHVRARRHRLGRGDPDRDRGAGQLQPRRAHRPGGQLPVRRPGDDGDQDLRPADRLAELDLQPAQRVRPRRRAAPVRHRPAGRLRPEASLNAMTTSRRLHREDPEQRQPARGPAAAAGAGVLAAELPELVAVDGPDAADPGRLPAHRGQRRPGGLGALRPRRDARVPLGHLPGRARPGPADRVRRAQGRAGVARCPGSTGPSCGG